LQVKSDEILATERRLQNCKKLHKTTKTTKTKIKTKNRDGKKLHLFFNNSFYAAI
jgi:hypothetical protein